MQTANFLIVRTTIETNILTIKHTATNACCHLVYWRNFQIFTMDSCTAAHSSRNISDVYEFKFDRKLPIVILGISYIDFDAIDGLLKKGSCNSEREYSFDENLC